LQKADERTSRGGERYTNDSEAFFACRGNPAWNEMMYAALQARIPGIPKSFGRLTLKEADYS
jgi:hypothetical protein